MKKLISLLLVLSSVFSFYLPAAAAGFRDVSDENLRQNVAVLQALKVLTECLTAPSGPTAY